MAGAGPKADLHRYLQAAREALLWKLDGLSEYDIRRPLTPTGTNLLGLVKHLAGVELWYFGDAFGRPPSGPRPWSADDTRNNADMWATADESREQIVGCTGKPGRTRMRPSRRGTWTRPATCPGGQAAEVR